MFGLRKIAPLIAIGIIGVFGLLYGSYPASGQNSVQKGMAITAYYKDYYQTADSDQRVEDIAATGADHLTILVTQYQYTTSSTTIYPTDQTPTDADLVHIINKAKSLGMKIVLKPHVDILNPISEWRGRIGQDFDESQWADWFSAYRDFIGHYADLSEEHGVEQIIIGTEFVIASRRESDWRGVVSHVRDRYNGKLTYSANHGGEEINVQWWDALDYIGISGYYDLTDKRNPTIAELKAEWDPIIETISAMSEEWGRPVVFTEVGYRSIDGTNMRPWCHFCVDEPIDLQEQADAYQAFFESVYQQPWFAGVYWWSWGLRQQDNGPCSDGYSPHLKPAENVLRQYFGGNQITLPTTCDGTSPTPTPGPTPTSVLPTAVPPTAVPPTAAPPTAAPPTTVPGQCGGLRQEAESATIGSGSNGAGAFTIGTDSDSSAGSYIKANESSANGSYNSSANATFCVNVPTSGIYGLRSRALAENSSSDSLFFYVDGAPVDGNIWHLWATGSYAIIDLYTTQPGAAAQSRFEIQLAAGEHEIAFAGRDQGPQLDWIELILLEESPIEPTPVPPTATSVPATATFVPATATFVPATATFVPATTTSLPATATSLPATATSVPATATSVPATATSVPATATSVPPTATSVPPTATSVPATATSLPAAATSVPATATSVPATATSASPTATSAPATMTAAPSAATSVPSTAVPSTATLVPTTAAPNATPNATPVAIESCPPLQQEAEQGELSGLFEVGSDNAASGGQFVSVPNGQENRGAELDNAQKIVFCVSISEPGPYFLRAWTNNFTGFDNSFYVRVNGLPAEGILWHTQISNEYTDEYISNYDAATNLFQQMKFTLDAGEHRVEFLLREDGVLLDKIAFEPDVSAASDDGQFFSDVQRLQNDISLVERQSSFDIYIPIIE